MNNINENKAGCKRTLKVRTPYVLMSSDYSQQ